MEVLIIIQRGILSAFKMMIMLTMMMMRGRRRRYEKKETEHMEGILSRVSSYEELVFALLGTLNTLINDDVVFSTKYVFLTYFYSNARF